jgi:hypothetical protein
VYLYRAGYVQSGADKIFACKRTILCENEDHMRLPFSLVNTGLYRQHISPISWMRVLILVKNITPIGSLELWFVIIYFKKSSRI